MDEWANPMVVSALWSSRDGTMDRNDHESLLKGGGQPPTLDSALALKRWDPWVRINLGVTELTRRIDYQAIAPDTFAVLNRSDAKNLVKMKRPGITFFEKQLPFVQSWAELRDERALEILAQIDNQFAFIASVTGLNVSRKRWTMEWLTVVIQFAIAVESRIKHAFACYRPVDLSPQVQPIITTPGHSSYPMGHAAQAFATMVALCGLLKIKSGSKIYTQLYRQARRISVNRTVAGVHFPIDAAAGQALGYSLGEFVLCASSVKDGTVNPKCFDRTFVPVGNGDDAANDYLGEGPEDPHGCTTGTSPLVVTTSDILEELAALARDEWDLP